MLLDLVGFGGMSIRDQCQVLGQSSTCINSFNSILQIEKSVRKNYDLEHLEQVTILENI